VKLAAWGWQSLYNSLKVNGLRLVAEGDPLWNAGCLTMRLLAPSSTTNGK